jgi:hypothetical protein
VHSIVVRVAQFFVTLAVGIAILGSLAAWRLSKGPVSLDFLTPALESSLAAQDMPFAVQVEETTLAWGGWRRVFDLRGVNVRIFGADGKIVALLPEISIGLSTAGLLQGDLGIARLDVFGLRAVLARHRDGRFDFGLPVESKDATEAGGSFADIASELLRSVREKRGPFQHLQRFSLLSAKVRYADEANGQLWVMPAADMITVFGAEVIESRFNMVVENGGDRTQLAATVVHDRETGRIGGRVDFNKLEPTLIARAVPQLSQFAGVRMPFTGSAHFDVETGWRLFGLRLQLASEAGRAAIALQYPPTGDHVQVVARLEDVQVGRLARATPALASLAGIDVAISGQIAGNAASARDFRLQRLDLSGGEGEIELPGILPRRVDVARLRLDASVSEDGDSVEIRDASVDFGGPRLRVKGAAVRAAGDYLVRAEGTVAGVPMALLDSYWPLGLGPPARRWVTANIVDGTVDAGNISLSAIVPADNPAGMRFETVNGALEYRGLSVDYLPPMSKFTGVGGTATFDRSRFDLAVTEGRLRDLAVDTASIRMFDLDTDIEKIAIDVALHGPARTVAHVLDEKPLRFLGEFALSPSAISGDAAVHGRFNFPLRKDLTASMVQVSATGTLQKLAISPAPRGLTVSDGTLTMQVDNAGLAATGTATLSGVRAAIDWQEQFGAGAKERRKLVFSGRIAEMRTPGFGLPDFRFLSGPADASVAYTQQAGGKGEMLINLEIADTAVRLPALGWTKAPGAAGTANLALSFDAKGLQQIDNLSVEAGEAKLLGHVETFGPERQAWLATIERYENAGNDLHGTVELRPDGGVYAELAGEQFDISGIVDFDASSDDGGAAAKLPPISIRANIDDLRWGPDRRVADAKVLVKFADEHIQGLVLDGGLGRDAVLSIRYLPGADGQVLRVAADDFGATLGMSPSRSRVTGGALLIRGTRRAPDAPLEGDFFASNFTLARAPLLARVLQVASLTGIGDALSRSGLSFDAFEGKFSYSNGQVTFANASAYGSSIGVSGNGVLDLGKDTATASGTLVPAYSLNRVLGKIPVIGSLLTGGENEGIFAATYRVEGPIDDPKIGVNPLSALAPGFLRNLFGLGADKAPAAAPAPAPASPTEPKEPAAPPG